ncbi:MAG: FeoA family protein [Christensenellales bacterium]
MIWASPPGTEIKIIKAAPMGDPIEIAMRGYSLSLRREDAQRIELLTDGEAKELRRRPYFPPETWSSRRRTALPTVRTRMRLITAVQQ